MLIALGKVDMNVLIDDLILMAKDENCVHEHNEKKKVRKWKHEDGWGVAYLKNRRWVVQKSARSILKDPEIHSLRRLTPKVVLMHARKRTQGKTTINEVHPFQVKDFIFAHNGTIRGEIYHQKDITFSGTTDSERLFRSILRKFDGNPQTIKDKLAGCDINTGSNVIFSTPKKTIVYVYYKKYPKYYTMMLGQGKDSVVVSSEKLPHLKGMNWQRLENGDLVTINHQTLKVSIEKETTQP